MPNEPERDIEKTLKAYAEKRKADAGAPRPLHPATRELLRGEALRTHKPKPAGHFFSIEWWRESWPQWVIGCGIIVMLGVTLSVLLTNSSKEKRVARQQLAQAPALDDRKFTAHRALHAPNTIATNAPAERALAQYKSKEATKDLPPNATTASAPVASGFNGNADQSSYNTIALNGRAARVMPTAPSANGGNASPKETPQATLSYDTAAVAPAPSPASPAPLAAPAIVASPAPAPLAVNPPGDLPGDAEKPDKTHFASAGEVIVKKFVRVAAAKSNFGSSRNRAARSLLSSFQMETAGDSVTIVDGDGSVYTGHWVREIAPGGDVIDKLKQTNVAMALASRAPASESEGISAQSEKHPANKPASLPIAPDSGGARFVVTNFTFRVSGTNVTSRKLVVFNGTCSGNILNVTNAILDGAAHNTSVTALGNSEVMTTSGRIAGLNSNEIVYSNFVPYNPLTLLGLEVNGQATIGTNRVDISAKQAGTR